MQTILPTTRSLPLFGVDATRTIEAQAAATLPPHTLMRRAGHAVARLALALAPHASRVWIAAGPGNNGGGGLEGASPPKGGATQAMARPGRATTAAMGSRPRFI